MCRLSSNWLVVSFRAVFQEFCVQPEVTILHLSEEFCSFRRTQRYSLRRNQDPALLLHYCFLTDPLLFLHSFPSLVSNCLNLFFGMQRRLRRLNEAQFLQTKNSAWKVFVPGRAPGESCWVSVWMFVFPPQIHMLKASTHMVVFGGGTFKGTKVLNEINALIRVSQERSLVPPVGGYYKSSTTQKKFLNWPCWHFDLGFLASWTVRNQFL